MPDLVQFVDQISGSPTVRLDLNDDAKWNLKYEGTDFSPPGLKQAWASTLLADGETLTAAAYENRRIRLRLDLTTATLDDAFTEVQKLHRELNRPTNLLKWQPQGATAPEFFRTMRSLSNRVTEYPGAGLLRTIDVEIVAAPFAYGLKETLPAVTVYADPAESTALNANPFFETNAANWTGMGGTVVRSTAQAHEGVASLLLTPDGVAGNAQARAELVPVTASASHRASCWVRCAVARNVSVAVDWHDSGGGSLSQSIATVAVAASTWTLLELTASAPVSAAQARLIVQLGSTPPVGHTLHIDEARIRPAGGAGGCCFDVTGIKGDVETPLYLTVSPTNLLAGSLLGRKMSAVAVRRRGTPSQVPFVLQAEAMSMASADTTVQANSVVMSGSGSNWARTTFATSAALDTRLNTSVWPAVGGVDLRGQYRVLMRYRQSAGTAAPMQARLVWGVTGSGQAFTNDTALLVRQDGTGGPYMKYADLGIVQLPPGYDPVTDGPTGVEVGSEGIFLNVQAARPSGTANLDIDLLLFLPADDRLLFVTWPATTTPPTDLVLDSDRGQVYARGATGLSVGLGGAELAGGPPLVSPGVSNRITFVRDVGTASSTSGFGTGDDITASTTITPYYWPRFLYARPLSS